jgi:hypothetical protein
MSWTFYFDEDVAQPEANVGVGRFVWNESQQGPNGDGTFFELAKSLSMAKWELDSAYRDGWKVTINNERDAYLKRIDLRDGQQKTDVETFLNAP